MKTRILAVILAMLAAPLVSQAADEENPFKNVKVGDYAKYKMTTKIGTIDIAGSTTTKVKAKDDKEVTIVSTTSVMGMDVPQEQKIDLTKPYDITKNAGSLPPGAKVEKLKDGKEKVKVAGKEYDCKWESYKMKFETGGQTLEGEIKVWNSKEVAMHMVKMEMTAEIAGMKMVVNVDLEETGNKKD